MNNDLLIVVGVAVLGLTALGLEFSRQFSAGGEFVQAFLDMLTTLSMAIHIYALLGILFGGGALVSVIFKMDELKSERLKELYPSPLEQHQSLKDRTFDNIRWEQIQEHINSKNSNDWQMAVLEADKLLGQALEQKGFAGETIGEKLKQADPSDLLSLERAWDAHKLRNRIAHDSTPPDHRTAQQAIEDYRAVLQELGYI